MSVLHSTTSAPQHLRHPYFPAWPFEPTQNPYHAWNTELYEVDKSYKGLWEGMSRRCAVRFKNFHFIHRHKEGQKKYLTWIKKATVWPSAKTQSQRKVRLRTEVYNIGVFSCTSMPSQFAQTANSPSFYKHKIKVSCSQGEPVS